MLSCLQSLLRWGLGWGYEAQRSPNISKQTCLKKEFRCLGCTQSNLCRWDSKICTLVGPASESNGTSPVNRNWLAGQLLQSMKYLPTWGKQRSLEMVWRQGWGGWGGGGRVRCKISGQISLDKAVPYNYLFLLIKDSYCLWKALRGVPGWLSQVSDSWFGLRSWCHSLWNRAPYPALHWQLSACLGFSLPLSAPRPHSLSKLKKNK